MIHTKSLIRRLAYVPWLLAAGLLLGWAGEAVADIRLTVDKDRLREDGGKQDITVTATNYASAAADAAKANVTRDTDVTLGLVDYTGQSTEFRITLPTITIPKDKNTGSATVVFTPVVNTERKADRAISITGGAGTIDVVAADITLIDTDKASDAVLLTFDPAKISKEAGATSVEVTATLDGEVQTKDVTFRLLSNTKTASGDPAEGSTASELATRDTDYDLVLGNITIPRKRASGKTTITVTPKNVGDGKIYIRGLNTVSSTPTPVTLTTDEGTFIEITEDKVAAISGLTATPHTIRENAGRQEITLKVSLKDELTKDSEVTFTIEDDVADITVPDNDRTTALNVRLEDADAANRDVNYTAVIGDLTIPKGSKDGETTLILTPIDNDGENRAIAFKLKAVVGGTDLLEVIKIADDESVSENISLMASPSEIKEDAGETEVMVTAALDGKVLEDDTALILVLGDGTATRDVDYTAILRSVTIPAGEVMGSTTVSITPIDEGVVDADETIILKALKNPKNEDDEDIVVGTATVKLKDTGVKATPGTPGDTTPTFAADLGATVLEGVVDMPVSWDALPEATGDGDLTYSVSATLPPGLMFDSATRMISGTPTKVGTHSIIYTVIDGDETDPDSAVQTFTIEIAEAVAPTFEVANVTSTHSSVRENGSTTTIALTATLAAASATDETVNFTVVSPTAGASAVRDVDYSASLEGVITIAAGDTEGTTTLVLTPIDNDAVDGDKFLGVQAAASGGSAQVDIKIADDETASTSISLSVDPHTVSESLGVTSLTVTATLDGKVLDADAIVTISIDSGTSTAVRDVDYSALFNPLLTIPAGSVSGSIVLLIDPTADNDDTEGSELISVQGAIDGLANGSAMITLSDGEAMPTQEPLAFADGTSIDDQQYTAGAAISVMQLPAAMGGLGDLTYSVSGLPAGLSFDPDTRMISGTPEAATEAEVTYTATDGAGSTVSITFSIKINPEISFTEFFGQFGAGKANPAAELREDGVLLFVAGQPDGLTLPTAAGGTPPLRYSLSGLPAGLSFDPATRTISGTPTEVGGPHVLTYTATDGSGAAQTTQFSIEIVAPSLDGPNALVAEDYMGADGSGDQGGFVLLTWDLSEDHDTLDGYRIFREVLMTHGLSTPPENVEHDHEHFHDHTGVTHAHPHAHNGGGDAEPHSHDHAEEDDMMGEGAVIALDVPVMEMMPWAHIDAVPGVKIGRAVVATLDNVASHWGIAAERNGMTTHEAAKAVFVSTDSPYELMAETLQASREVSQAGDAPVFATLLPEALAFAEGIAPRLNYVEGVLESSAMTLTEESVRAIDNIAPLAVPSLSVLDAPNDQGSRILVTWTLSPSDQPLQGVVAGTIGPAAVGPVVGVHGYGIYRRTAGEDEFALIAQVDAGVTSFVDETVLNGVRYSYQVRPYDLDNETGSALAPTALAVRNSVLDSEGHAIFGLFGADNRVGFDDFFLFADHFGLTAADAGFDPAFDLAPNAMIDFDDFFVFADHFGRSMAGAGKLVPMLAGLNADARLYLDARSSLPEVGEDFVVDVRVADFVAVKGYGLQVQYDASKLSFVQTLTEQPLGGSELAAPQVLSDEGGLLALVAHGDVVSEGEVELSLVFRAKTEIENTVIEITDTQTYDSEFGFNRLALPAPVQLQTRPEVFALANNYPNPFNPATTIKYALPQASDVELTVYNVVGQAVRTLVAEHQSAGRYVVEWDATNDSGHSLSSGMYFYRLQAGGEFREVKKMLLLK